jgi:SAM-dependent methyltransferase
MNLEDAPQTDVAARRNRSPIRSDLNLFIISLLILFLELACIRWFPAHVLFLTFFTNTVLLASFLGMSLGCLAAGHQRNYFSWTPAFLALAVLAALGVELVYQLQGNIVDVGNQSSPQLIFFGTEHPKTDVARFFIPIEALGGSFFVAIALVFVGLGQELGRALNSYPNRLRAYSLNIAGSLIGIVIFAACSWWELAPFWWFLPVVLTVALILVRISPRRDLPVRWALLAVTLLGVSLHSAANLRSDQAVQFLWSPYYRIDYDTAHRSLAVNQIGHQTMHSRTANAPAYALPYLLRRDSERLPFQDVLIIGAGSGNDVSRALQWGAANVDAVEIDPAIQRLGARDHPDHPYQDSRVTVHLDDGRNFLRSTDKQYDLILYALVDSLVLHSSFSNIRLESYLFTEQAFADVRRHLKPGGLFIAYNFFRQGWLVARLQKELTHVFGTEPLVLPLPARKVIKPDDFLEGEFTVFLAGDTEPVRTALQKNGGYWLTSQHAPSPDSPNGFLTPTAAERAQLHHLAEQGQEMPWTQFDLAQVVQPKEPLRLATDDWPFLYLRQPMVPDLSLRGMAVMCGLAMLLLLLFLRTDRRQTESWGSQGRMFFLGAGFMLVETKAVVHMALLFGSTWMVNSIVFFGVLVMILAANFFVALIQPRRLWPYYIGLFVTLVLMALVPLDYFLGMNRTFQVAGSSLLVCAPIFFAGVIFATSFASTVEPNRAFGANIAGAMVGGLAENTSMLLGFQHLVLVALGFYVLSALMNMRTRSAPADHRLADYLATQGPRT